MVSLNRHACEIFPLMKAGLFLQLLVYCCHYFPSNAQFFGTGSSRLEEQAQEIAKEMAQEYKEIIEDKE